MGLRDKDLVAMYEDMTGEKVDNVMCIYEPDRYCEPGELYNCSICGRCKRQQEDDNES